MKKIFILALAIGFISCSSDESNSEETATPNLENRYNLQIRSPHNLEWTAYNKNNSPDALSACFSSTIRQGDTLRVWGHLNFNETDIEVVLRKMGTDEEIVIPLNLSGQYLTGGQYRYRHCYNSNGEVVSSGGELFGTSDGITKIIIQ